LRWTPGAAEISPPCIAGSRKPCLVFPILAWPLLNVRPLADLRSTASSFARVPLFRRKYFNLRVTPRPCASPSTGADDVQSARPPGGRVFFCGDLPVQTFPPSPFFLLGKAEFFLEAGFFVALGHWGPNISPLGASVGFPFPKKAFEEIPPFSLSCNLRYVFSSLVDGRVSFSLGGRLYLFIRGWFDSLTLFLC